MRDEIHAYLDGEIGFEELPPELRAEARRWERFLEEARALDPVGAPAGLGSRTMRAILATPTPAWRRALAWLWRPQPIRVPPIAAVAIAAAFVLLVVGPWRAPEAPQQTATRDVMYVQFSLEAPSASSVAVLGDFTGWRPEIPLHDPDGDGVWAGMAPVGAGIHEYMFLVDGEWVTDPRAERYTDDGFGNRNAVLVVAPPTRL